ncbi:MAG: hypothetical protein ABH879_09115 [archaeon]
MGFLTKRLFKSRSPFLMYMAGRRSVKDLTRDTSRMDAILEVLPRLVENEHLLEEAMPKQKQLSELAGEAEEESQGFFNITAVEDSVALGKIERIVGACVQLIKAVAEKKIVDSRGQRVSPRMGKKFKVTVVGALEEGKSELRNEYRDVINLIDDAKPHTQESFMGMVKVAAKKTRGSWGKYMAMRHNLGELRGQLRRMGNDYSSMVNMRRKFLADLKSGKLRVDQLEKNYDTWVDNFTLHVTTFFQNSYRAQKRDLLIIFGILDALHSYLSDLIRWRKGSLEPTDVLDGEQKKVYTLFRRLLSAAQEEAQALRVLISADEKAESDAARVWKAAA